MSRLHICHFLVIVTIAGCGNEKQESGSSVTPSSVPDKPPPTVDESKSTPTTNAKHTPKANPAADESNQRRLQAPNVPPKRAWKDDGRHLVELALKNVNSLYSETLRTRSNQCKQDLKSHRFSGEKFKKPAKLSSEWIEVKSYQGKHVIYRQEDGPTPEILIDDNAFVLAQGHEWGFNCVGILSMKQVTLTRTEIKGLVFRTGNEPAPVKIQVDVNPVTSLALWTFSKNHRLVMTPRSSAQHMKVIGIDRSKCPGCKVPNFDWGADVPNLKDIR